MVWGPQNQGFRSDTIYVIAAILNTRLHSYILRALTPSPMHFRKGYLYNLPLPSSFSDSSFNNLKKIVNVMIYLKNRLISNIPYEYFFEINNNIIELLNRNKAIHRISAILLLLEGYSEYFIFKQYTLNDQDYKVILSETGTPAGWFPLITGYDNPKPLLEELPEISSEVFSFIQNHELRFPEIQELETIKKRLRNFYEVGPGVLEDVDDTDGKASEEDEEENEKSAYGARIPIPAEYFIEELSQKIEIHPISVYWLIQEGIDQEGWRCLPEEQRLTKDRFTVLILRLLGHRWPKQIEAGEPVPDWADDDGIIPLMEGTAEATLNARLRGRLAADHGDERVSSEENAFEDTLGKPLAEWIRKDFFRHHISQFKKRPIAWHISSAKWISRPRQDAAFECLTYYQKTDGDLLPKLKSQYVIPLVKRLEMEQRSLENANGGLTGEQKEKKDSLFNRIQELKDIDDVLTEISASGFGPKAHLPQLRQYAINDAMLCLKARWLKKLSGVIQADPLTDWRDQADRTCLHEDFSTWITEAVIHLDYHCAKIVPKPPLEKALNDDPTAKELADTICAESESMLTEALKCACAVWWKTFDATILKPISEKIRDAKKEHQSLKEQFRHPEGDFNEQADMNRKINAMKSDINAWQKELTFKSGQGKAVRYAIESWSCPEALAWESWLAEQPLYDQLSGLNGKRPPPQTIAEFIRQESLYQPDINDGVRVNIAPLQKAGLLAADVLAGKDVDKAIADRAAWRDDERRWCREGKLPKPGWWE